MSRRVLSLPLCLFCVVRAAQFEEEALSALARDYFVQSKQERHERQKREESGHLSVADFRQY